MVVRLLAAVAAYAGFALAQGSVNGQVGAENATTPTAQEGNITIHYVTVGHALNNFYPNSINAEPGDIVTFQFYPTNHSVIKAAWGYPCIPYEDNGYSGNTFYSGWMPVDNVDADHPPPTWNLTINSTEPVFYYCGAPGSCIDWGMVGVINANASTPISTQISIARKANFQLIPGEDWPSEAQQASMASLAATATTATLTVTATGAHQTNEYGAYPNNGTGNGGNNNNNYDNHVYQHGLSSGAVAGIAVGSAVAALGAAALFFLMCRTRSLKRKLDRQQTGQQHPQGPNMMSPGPGAFAHTGTWPAPADSRHASSLPPYQAYTQTNDEVAKPPDADGLGIGRTLSPQQSPYNGQGQQFMPYHQLVNQNQRFTSHSELSGYPVVELDAPQQQQMAERTGSRFS